MHDAENSSARNNACRRWHRHSARRSNFVPSSKKSLEPTNSNKSSIEYSTLYQASVLHQRRTGLHVWMSQISTDRPHSNRRIRSPKQIFVVIWWKFLPSFQNRLEWYNGSPFLDFKKVLSVLAAFFPMLGQTYVDLVVKRG